VRRVLDYVSSAAEQAEAFLKSIDHHSPLLHTDALTFMLIDHSLGSSFVSQESADVLAEIEASDAKGRTDLLRRVALLWALRRTMDPGEHAEHVKKFVKRIQSAELDALSEARLLVSDAVADRSSVEIQKAIGRRLRRLTRSIPGVLNPLLPYN